MGNSSNTYWPKPSFIHCELGATWEVPIEIEKGPKHPPLGRFRFTQLWDGRSIQAGENRAHSLDLLFPNGQHPRFVRRFLKETELPIIRMQVVEHARRSDRYAGRLTLTRPPRTATLEGPLVVALTQNVIDTWTGSPGSGDISRLGERMLLELPGDDAKLVIVQTPVLLHAEEEGDQIRLLTADSRILHGRVESEGTRHRLLINDIERAVVSREMGHIVRFGGVVIKLPAGLRIVDAEDEDEESWMASWDIDLIRPVRNRILTAWLHYHELERKQAAGMLEERSRPLRYQEARQSKSDWRLRLSVLPEELRPWLSDKKINPQKVSVRQAVRITAPTGDESFGEGELSHFVDVDIDTGTAWAIVKLRAKRGLAQKTPPPHGLIHAIADPGEGKQSKRRLEAATRLIQGDVANSRVLDWLLSPTSVRPPSPKLRSPLTRPTPNDRQMEAVARALGLEDLLLVQGPPGTGKTQVIVELLLQLQQQHRNDEEPLRVLVSSIQNDAVSNAITKLRNIRQVGGDSFRSPALAIYQLPRFQERDVIAKQEADEGRRAAATLRASVEDDEVVSHHDALVELDLEIQELEQEFIASSERGEGPKELIDKLEKTLGGPKSVALLTDHLRRETSQRAQRLLRDAESSRIEAKEPGPASQEVSPRLRSILRRPLTEELARELLEMAPQVSSTVSDPALSALLEDLVRRLTRKLSRGRPIDRLQSSWQQLAGMIASNDDSPKVAAEKPRPVRTTETVLLSLTSELRSWLEDRRGRLERNAGIVRRRLADALERRPQTWAELQEMYATVLGATCQRSDLFRESDRPFHMVIVDEAGRATPLDLLIPMTMAERVVLIGDQKQLPPMVENILQRQVEKQQADPVSLSEETLFSVLFDEVVSANRIQLDVQYRMHETIGTLVSDLFYPGRLTSFWSGDRANKRLPDLGFFGDLPLVWVETGEVLGRKEKHEANEVEREVVSRILDRLLEMERNQELDVEGPVLGVITFYSEQRAELQQLINERPMLHGKVECGTVDSFQGKEFPIVVLSTVKHNASGRMGFLALPNRINVAFSRAQRQLIVLGSGRTAARYRQRPFLGSRYLLEARDRCQDPERDDTRHIDAGSFLANPKTHLTSTRSVEVE